MNISPVSQVQYVDQPHEVQSKAVVLKAPILPNADILRVEVYLWNHRNDYANVHVNRLEYIAEELHLNTLQLKATLNQLIKAGFVYSVEYFVYGIGYFETYHLTPAGEEALLDKL